MTAITQIRHAHSDGRAYYDRKIAEGKTHKEALRSLKRRISDAIYARLQDDARRAAQSAAAGPGGQPGNDSDSSAAGRPRTPALRTSHSRARHPDTTTRHPTPATRSASARHEGSPPSPLTALSKRSRYVRWRDCLA